MVARSIDLSKYHENQEMSTYRLYFMYSRKDALSENAPARSEGSIS